MDLREQGEEQESAAQTDSHVTAPGLVCAAMQWTRWTRREVEPPRVCSVPVPGPTLGPRHFKTRRTQVPPLGLG